MQKTPFTIVRREGMPDAATNGQTLLMCLDEGGKVFLRRGIKGVMQGPLAEKLLPQLNQLSGELLANPELSPADIAARLHALQLNCVVPEQQSIEWTVAELDGVRVYTDGTQIYLTKQDLVVGHQLA
jgi:hypothetical protein